MSSSPTPLMYAELLSNIRRVSVIASFPTPATADTTARLSPDRQQLLLSHNGETSFLTLPALVAASSALQQPTPGSREISWSLAAADQAPPNVAIDFSDSVVAPWAASKLSTGTEILCRKCAAVLVSAGTIRSWRDLPSQNWAEMMDFWHCHKPSEHKNGNKQADGHDHDAVKGYGANNPFVAQPGVGFVDLTYFLLAEKDCPGVEANPNTSPAADLLCKTCHAQIGHLDPLASGFRLLKYSLSLPAAQPATPPLSHFLAASLLSLASAQAIRKFILHDPSPPPPAPAPATPPPILHLWLFAPHLTVSFSAPTTPTPRTAPFAAAKLFYECLAPAQMRALLARADGGPGASLADAVEEMQVSRLVVEEVEALLRASTAALPASARRFGRWEVGLLERGGEGA